MRSASLWRLCICLQFLGLSPGSLLTALGFGLGTAVLPRLIMFPAMGYGWFGTEGREGNRLFLSSLITHCFYGAGLWVAGPILTS